MGPVADDALQYRGWTIEIDVRRVWDGSGWRAFAFVGTYVRGDLRLVPLSFSDARTFETEVAAHAATVILARAWIDAQG